MILASNKAEGSIDNWNGLSSNLAFARARTLSHLRKETKMKRINALLGILLAAILLAGCATTGARSVKGGTATCPACDFEFNPPSEA
jgi:hypothetical protein